MTTSRQNNNVPDVGETGDAPVSTAGSSGRHFKTSPAQETDAAGSTAPSPVGKRFKHQAEPGAEKPESALPTSGVSPAHSATADGASSSADSIEVLRPAAEERASASAEDDSHEHGYWVKKRRRRVPKALKVLGIVLLVCLVVGGGGALALRYMINSGGEALLQSAEADDLQTAEGAESEDNGQTVEYNGRTYRYNKNVVSIVVMGVDRRTSVEESGKAGQADAIMVVAMDTKTGLMRVIGIPRDTMVDVDENLGEAFLGQDQMQITLAYSYGDGYDESCKNVVRAVSRVLYNMPMNYYFCINMAGIGPLNDAVGGVSLTPLASIPGTNIYEGVPMTLYGSNATRYVQYRDTSYVESSLDRQARQSQYLKAFFSQAIGAAKGNPAVLVELFQASLQYSTTNLGLNEFSFLASTLLKYGMSELDVTTLAGEAVKGSQYVEFHPDQESVYQTVLDVFYTPVDDGGTEDSADGSATDAAVTDGPSDAVSDAAVSDAQ